MIKKLEIENIAHAFPEVAFSEDYIIGTFQMRIKTSNVERLTLATASEQTTGTWIKVGADSFEKQKRFGAKVVAIYEVPDAGAEIFYQAAKGGIDIIKDDELLPADESFCPLKERVTKFMAMEKRVFEETGEHTLYSVNITDRAEKIRDNALRAIEYGANSLMLNVYTASHGAFQMLAEDPDIQVTILAHVDFVGAYAGSTYTGISAPLVIGKLTRLAGGDFQINGHPWGKFPIPFKTFYRSFKFFTQPWWHIKPMMYACSGGTTQLVVKNMIDALGTDIILAAGGGVHGHPDGSLAGAKSMRQAIDAAVEGINLLEYAKTHKELMRMAEMLDPDVLKNFDLMK